MTENDKAALLLASAIETVEGYTQQFASLDDKPKMRAHMGGLLMGIAFSGVVRELGWLESLRILIGCIFVAIRFKPLAKL